MSARWLFTWIGLLAFAAGAALWWAMRPAAPPEPAALPEISAAALAAATFTDAQGARHSIGELQGRPVVLNFWATWCAPCREEMPTFERLQREWAGRVRFVGLSDEDPAKVAQYARVHGISYPLWTGGDAVGELGRRLGNQQSVLPFSVVLGRDGTPLAAKVGPYTEVELRKALAPNLQ